MFQFVSYEGPSLPRDAKVRSAIHLRAMQHNAALRKQRNGYAKKRPKQSNRAPEDGTYAKVLSTHKIVEYMHLALAAFEY